jgi:dTDP-4-amino-4,6-dideoxygalactose transaminase
MKKTNLSNWPSFNQEEIDAVTNVLLSNKVNYWTGNECREFEKDFSKWINVDYCVSVANGTVALELALIALGINPGDEIIVTPRTFIASVSCIVKIGAIPVFVDVDKNSQNITAATIEPAISKNTKAIICVHLGGYPCDMDEIMTLANSNNLFVIEDCAQAHGAKYKDRYVGSIGHIGAWSFCQDKIMSTGGEGGMVSTNDEQLWLKMWSYKDHGKSWDKVNNKSNSISFRWLHESFGTNFRMTEMQAAIGIVQLNKISAWHLSRSNNSRAIIDTCAKFPTLFRIPYSPDYIEQAWYRCYIFVNKKGLKSDWTRDRIIAEINDRSVPCTVGSCSEIYLEKTFESTNCVPTKRLRVARNLGETSLAFLVHPNLTLEEVSLMCQVIKEVALRASR